MNNNQTIGDNVVYNYINIRVAGKNPTKPGDGGNGGVGGNGGHAGTHLIVGLKDQPKFSIVANKGENGIPGTGGASGNESRNGITTDFLFLNKYNTTTVIYEKPTNIANCPVKSVGVDGMDGSNKIGIDNPDAVKPINPSHVINNYKSFVRSEAVECQKILEGINFVEDIDKNEVIQSLYDTLGFVDEMMGIENQYFKLKKKALTSYFTSLLKRTDKLAQNFNESSENKSVLTWLYTTIMMRLSTVTTNTAPIVDLPEYLNEIEVHILKFRRNKIEVNVIDQQYSINNEIRSVDAFIKNRILPDLETIFVKINSHVSTMIDELFERQYKFIPEEDPCSEGNDTNFSQLMMRRQDKMFTFKALNAFNTVEDAENEVTDEWRRDSHSFSVDLNSTFFERVKHSEKYKLFIKQLYDIERELNKFSKSESNSLTNIIRNVSKLNADLTEQLRNGVFYPNDVDHKRDELISLFEEQQSELQFSEDLSTTFDIILAILNLRDVSIDFYKQLPVEYISELLDVYEIANQMTEEADEENLKIENIFDTILEQFLKMETSVRKISSELINKSHFKLEESKWRTLAIIRDVKAIFRKLGNDTTVLELLCRSIDKLDDTTIFLFEAYDYIDHLNRENSANGFVDNTLNDTIKKLEKIIQMNIIIEKYGLAVKTFEQLQFPFANKILLSHLKLPTDLQPDDDNKEKLAQVIIDRFYYLKNKVKTLEVLIGKYDDSVLSDIEFSSNERSIVGPFYKWELPSKSNEYKLNFLKGEEIELEPATINRASFVQAVKFNEIGIKLIIDEKKQKDLDYKLQKCILTMTMTGKGDYLCDKKIHSFPVDDIRITYSFKHNSNGQPVMKNDVYKKIDGTHYFLSPYTTWKIQIQNLGKEDLTIFKDDKIILELFGRGQYVQQSPFLSKVCSELKSETS